jgi:hypothetical protein
MAHCELVKIRKRKKIAGRLGQGEVSEARPHWLVGALQGQKAVGYATIAFLVVACVVLAAGFVLMGQRDHSQIAKEDRTVIENFADRFRQLFNGSETGVGGP